jgi:hypothetical protein
LYWKSVEPVNTTPENYQWTGWDSAFQNMRDAGMVPHVFVTENPTWAANLRCGPIDTGNAAMLAEFAEFMGALAARYPEVSVWTMYNEADHSKGILNHTGGCFGDSATEDVNLNGIPDYADYAEMTAAARSAVHQANPNAKVAFAVAFDDFDKATCPPKYPGACPPNSHFNYNFLPKLFGYMAEHPRPNGEPYADLLAFTFYSIYGPYWERQRSGAGWHGIQAKAAAIRQRMADAGISIPLFVTETGEDSAKSWIGVDGQSQCTVRNLVRGIAADLHSVTWWTFRDYPQYGWYYGVVDANLAPKQSYMAYQTLVQNLRGANFIKMKSAKHAEAYLFDKGGKAFVVAWSGAETSNGKAPCANPRRWVPLNFMTERLRVSDMYGNTMEIADNDEFDLNADTGKIKLMVDGYPRYFTLNP